MLWFALRYYRLNIVFTAIISSSILIVFGIDGRRVTNLVTAGGSEAAIFAEWEKLQPVLTPLSLLPLVVGAFWGAPLYARHQEQKTLVLLWSQGRSRSSWLSASLGLHAALAATLGLATGVAVSGWLSSFGEAGLPGTGEDLSFFASRDIAPIAWNLCLLSIGVGLGGLNQASTARNGLDLGTRPSIDPSLEYRSRKSICRVRRT